MKNVLLCWQSAPAECGRIVWDFPLWEVLASLVLTAGVTFLTIWVSVRQARKETDRVLEDGVRKQVGSVVADLSADADAAFWAAPEVVAAQRPTWSRAVTADSVLRTSGLPFASEVALWVDGMAAYSRMLRDKGIEAGLPERFWEDQVLLERGPGGAVAKRLAQYLKNPEKVGAELAADSTKLWDRFQKSTTTEEALAAVLRSFKPASEQAMSDVKGAERAAAKRRIRTARATR